MERGQPAGARLGRPATKAESFAEPELLTNARQRHRADQRRAHLGQLTFVVGREAIKEVLRSHQFQHRITEVLQAFVVTAFGAALVDPRGVGHRLKQPLSAFELDVEPLLQLLEPALLRQLLLDLLLRARLRPAPPGGRSSLGASR